MHELQFGRGDRITQPSLLMKFPKHLRFVVLFLAGAAWLWHGETQRRELEAGISRLRTQLDRPVPPPDPQSRPARRSAIERQSPDWQAVATELRGGQSIGGLVATNARLRELIEAMSVAELVAALDEIAAADLGKGDRDALELELAAALLMKDPELGFTRFAVRERSDWSFFLGEQMESWVTRDDDAALAWLQRHAASGGHIFSQMISDPFFALLRTAPETSASVLATLPPDRRLESLRSLAMRRLRDGGQQEWAMIVRGNLPPEDRLKAIAWPLGNWSDGDGSPMQLDEIDAYLGRIGASDEERNACVMMVAEEPNSWGGGHETPDEGREALQRMRSWVEGRAPELLEPATIRAVEALAGSFKFAEASVLALEFHEQTGNDAYLTGVLEHVDDLSEAETVRELVGRLSDPHLQAKYRKEFPRKLK